MKVYGLGDGRLNGRKLVVASYLEDQLIPYSLKKYLNHVPKKNILITCLNCLKNCAIHMVMILISSMNCHHRLTPIEVARLGKELEALSFILA